MKNLPDLDLDALFAAIDLLEKIDPTDTYSIIGVKLTDAQHEAKARHVNAQAWELSRKARALAVTAQVDLDLVGS